MDIKELRYGNCVSLSETYRNIGDLLILDQTKSEALIIFKSYDRIYPIPLTVDWLINLGFKEMEPSEYTYDAYSKDGIQFWNMDNKKLMIEKPSISHDIKYVHQLQNLFFALKGRDLELNITDEFAPPTLQQAIDRLNKAFSNE